ncbi:MAG TPA: DNA-binding response regulator, partial [Erysipelotrichaceae bacterium]|nr:DNA-binding response regulator [Erysipelotrichaceae bacterium]
MHTEKGLKMENQDHKRVNQCVRKLSAREWDIINAIAKGMSNREIAEKMIFTEGTIRNYLSIILEKLQLRDRTQLAIWYLQSGAKLRHAC